MLRNETALVMVLPEDGADVILTKLRTARTERVQLLVAEGAVALRRPEVAARINQYALAQGVDLTLISSDRQTVEAARAGGLEIMFVDEGRVLAPSRSRRPDLPATPYSTRVLERRQPAGATPQQDAARYELDAGPPPPAASADADVVAAVAGLSAALGSAGRTAGGALSDQELLAASLGADVGAVPAARTPAQAPQRSTKVPKLAGAQAAGALARPQPAVPAPPVGRSATSRRRAWQIFAVIGALLALLLTIGGLLLWSSRVSVSVAAPVRPDSVEPFAELTVPLAAEGSAGGTAIVAEVLAADVAVSQGGEVTEGTLTPSGTASGVVSILNSSSQSILLPAGTEFIAVRADGQEVPFASTAEVLVPGATTADQGAQIVTTRGQAQVPVAARSPGSGSNVDANTVRKISLPGGQPIALGAGNLIVSNPPIEGGSEQEVRIVKDSNVTALLAPALEALDEEGRRRLAAAAQGRGLALDSSTVLPGREALEQLQGFEQVADPPVGTTLDAASPRFVLTVAAAYSALGTPPDQPLERQLGAAVTEQLRQSGELQPGDCRAPVVTGWRWDGQRLLVDGEVIPDTQSPRCQGGLDAAALAQVREAVRGKSRAEAEAALDALVAQGVIGSYTLPDAAALPGFAWLIAVREG